MPTKGKGSHRENCGSEGKPKNNGENHNQSNPGRNSGGKGRGGRNG